DIDIGAQILIGSLCDVRRILGNVDGGKRMQADRNPVGFGLGTQGRTAFCSKGVKRLRARIQPEIDIVQPMGSGPAQAVFDGVLDANINTDTVDQLHGSSSPRGQGPMVCISSSKLDALLGPDT